MMIGSEAATLARMSEPFWSWFTPIVWTGFDPVRRDADRVAGARRFVAAIASAASLWFLATRVHSGCGWSLIGYNKGSIANWYYVGSTRAVGCCADIGATLGRSATIWPAIFEAAELAAVVGRVRKRDQARGGIA